MHAHARRCSHARARLKTRLLRSMLKFTTLADNQYARRKHVYCTQEICEDVGVVIKYPNECDASAMCVCCVYTREARRRDRRRDCCLLTETRSHARTVFSNTLARLRRTADKSKLKSHKTCAPQLGAASCCDDATFKFGRSARSSSPARCCCCWMCLWDLLLYSVRVRVYVCVSASVSEPAES